MEVENSLEQPSYCPSLSTTSSNCAEESTPHSKCKNVIGICKIHFCLALLQCFLGITLTCLGLFLRVHSPFLRQRETPYWSGIILLISGVLNLYLCVTDLSLHSFNCTSLALKIPAVVCSTVAVFLCFIVAIFPAIFVTRLNFIRSCDRETGRCTCLLLDDDKRVIHSYDHADVCSSVSNTLETSLISLCIFNSLGSLSCLWFVILIWKSRYSWQVK